MFVSALPPRCGFEAWFEPSPTSSSSRTHYRVYPRVDAVVSEVADRAAALHRRSKPLSAILPRKICRYAVAVLPLFAAPLSVNPSFSRLASAAAVGSKRCYFCGDGAVGEFIPVSARGDVFIPLDDVRNPPC